MLLTITTTHQPATDLGYLLHKSPFRLHSFALSFGQAHVFYPEATPERCTAALLLDVDPVGLVRNRKGPAGEGGTLAQYVNDRPYVASSFLSVAISRVLGSALGGRSKGRPELAATPIPLRAKISVVPCHGGERFLRRLFEPYYEPAKPFLPDDDKAPSLTAQQQYDDVLDIDDVSGKRIVSTRLHHTVTIREENSIAALEVMSRFAADPKWLIYLPPTMSPSETSREPDLLEHPAEAFSYYRHQGVARIVCEEKHMGSRAVVVVCRDVDAARKRFGVVEEIAGICYTRTGRRFFDDRAIEREFISSLQQSITEARMWEEFDTDWICLDCELMPWSAKAQELLRQQYAAVGAAARASLSDVISAVESAAQNDVDVTSILDRYRERLNAAEKYVDAYRRYCWPVRSLGDLKLAPFHLLAAEGVVFADRDHVWHMDTLRRLCDGAEGLLMATSYLVVDVTDPASAAAGIKWWQKLTGRGGEGMVVKPLDFIARGSRGLVQPAVKCRGKEYLRIIYGPEYTLPENLTRLRGRGLSRKRSLALREFALGMEGLERFVRKEPLRRVHECVFGVLALESEPVDPRL